jgi:hypothetical protein
MRSLARMVVRYLGEKTGNDDNAVICAVCRVCVFERKNDVYYAIRIRKRMLVGRMTAEIVGSWFRGRSLAARDDLLLEIPAAGLDVRPLFVSGESFTEMVLDERALTRFDSMTLTDTPAEWICRLDKGRIEYFSPKMCDRDLRFRTFVRSFANYVRDLLQQRPGAPD